MVVMDMMLPGLDGLGVLGHVGALGVDLPVVAMSASRRQLAAAMGAGARAVLYKPFDLKDLLDVVADHCTSCERVPTTSAAHASV